MDRPLDVAFVRGRLRRRLAIVAAIVGGVALLTAWTPRLLGTSLKRSAIRVARVERGSIEAVITASGLVVAEVERVLTTPVDARVLRVLKRPGAPVRPGEPVVELDLSAARLAVERHDQTLALKRNEQRQARLALQGQLATIESQRQAKRLVMQSHESQLRRRRELRAQGLVSDEDLQQTELAAAQAAIELKQMEADAAHAREATKARLEGLDLELATLHKERAEAARLLSLGTTRADRSGVVTWTVAEEGVSVRNGEAVARIADLTSFRVEATVSDIHAKRLSARLPVTIRLGDDELRGIVSNVLPAVRDGVLTFNVALEDSSSAILRPNLRVDVLVAMGRRENVLTLPRGPAIEGDGTRQLFVVRGDRAVRTRVRIGLLGFEACEIVDGLAEGDEVIVSDTGDYEHLEQVRIL